MKSFHFLIILLIIFIPAFLLGQSTNTTYSIAVLDFKNLTKNKGYDFLEKSIPESMATSLQQSGKVRIVERERIRELLDEKKLQLSGLTEQDVSGGREVALLAKADCLVIGSFSSAGEQIEVNARLVKVETGEVLLADKFTEFMGDKFFARVNEMADRMALSLSGEASGFLTIDSTPQGAEVRVEDRTIGITPLVQKKMKPGKYKATIIRSGFELKNIEFEINANSTTSRKELLTVKSEPLSKYHFSILAHPLPLFAQDYLMDFGASLDVMVNDFSLGVEAGGNYLSHKYQDTTAPGKTFYQEMKLLYFRFDAFLNYNFLADNPYLSPYLGAGAGFINVDSAEYSIRLMSFYYKGYVGFTFFPTSKLSLYTELIYQDLGNLRIQEKQFNLFGDYTLKSKDIPLRNFLIGFGLRFGF